MTGAVTVTATMPSEAVLAPFRSTRGSALMLGHVHPDADVLGTLLALGQTEKRLGTQADDFQTVFISVDPGRDTPAVLKGYARAHGANPAGWAFLTGTPAEIRDVARRYGVYVRKSPGGDVEHTFLTSLIDRDGVLRVQYLGVRFDPDELLSDVRRLLTEASGP